MQITVAKSVRDQVADSTTEELVFRVVADLPSRDLLTYVSAALAAFERDWERDQPVDRGWGPVPPPDHAVSPATPDVVVSLIKLSDVPVSFKRVLAALETELADTNVRVRIEKPKRARITIDTPVAMLNVRLALTGDWVNGDMFDNDVDLDLIEHRCLRWMRQLSPAGPLQWLRPDWRFSPLANGVELGTLRETRNHEIRCLLAVHGDTVRGIDTWLPNGWLSILSATTAPDTFDWREHWTDIDTLFRDLAPFADTAIVCHGSYLSSSAVVTHLNRELSQIPGRSASSAPHMERAIEDTGLVDAQGRFFKAHLPAGIPESWARRSYGHLTQVDAPNIDDWLQQPPTQDVLDQGRRDLANLLVR